VYINIKVVSASKAASCIQDAPETGLFFIKVCNYPLLYMIT